MKHQYYSALGIIIAGSSGLASADGLAENFEENNPVGIRADQTFQTGGSYDNDKDPGNQGDKEGNAVEEPVEYVRVDVDFGYNSNPYLWDSGFENAAFFTGVDFRTATIITDPTYSLYLAGKLGARWYEFEDPPRNRDGSDEFIYNLDLRAAFNSEITDTLQFNSFTRASFGGTGNSKLDFLYPAILDQNVLRLETNARFDWRLDNQQVGTNGWEFATDSEFLGFFGEEWSFADFNRVGVTQDIAYIVNPASRIGLRTHLSCSHYDMSYLNSENYRVGGFAEGIINQLYEYRAEAGYEWRGYDDAGLDDRDMFYLRGALNGEISNNVFLSSIVSYGTEDLYNNFFGPNFTQPDVFRLEGRVTADRGNYRVRAQLGAAKFNGEILGGSNDITQYTAGIGADTDINGYRIGATLEHIWGDRDFGPKFDYDQTRATVSIKATF